MSDENPNDALAKAVAMNRRTLGLPPQPAPTALTPEQAENSLAKITEVYEGKHVVREQDEAQRLTITRLERELEQAQGNYAIQKAAADEAEARWYRTNAQYESAAKAVTRQAGELERAKRERDEADRVAYDRAWKIDGLRQQLAQLQSSLAIAEARVRELEEG